MGARNQQKTHGHEHHQQAGRPRGSPKQKHCPPRPHFDDGCFKGGFEEACLSKVTNEHLINIINDCIRMATEDKGSAAADPINISEMRCYAMIRRIVAEAGGRVNKVG